MKGLRKILQILIYGFITFLVVTNFWIIYSTSNNIYSKLDDIPSKEVALVFGTSKYKTGGGDNQFFHNRIEAAANLYKSGKVARIILSGTRDSKYYDEPKDMFNALTKLGVPDNDVILDKEGFRTINSIINGKDQYDGFVLITQRYHAYRALFICNYYSLDAVCYEADFPSEDYSYKTVIREVFARPKAILDLYFLD